MNVRKPQEMLLRAGVVALITASTAQADVVFQRALNWLGGVAQGSTVNNPSTVGGLPTWQYEAASGGGSLGDPNPWYNQTPSLMVWDTGWFATGWGVWAKGYNESPPILPGRLIHNVHPTTWEDVPMVRWLNPYSNTAATIAGTLTVNWNGVLGLGRPVNVDVVIAKQNSITNVTTILYSNTVSKPNPFPSVGDSVLLPISLPNVALSAGDSIVVTHRGQQSVGPLGAWVNLYDGISITVVPAPGSMALLAMGGILVAGRRKR